MIDDNGLVAMQNAGGPCIGSYEVNQKGRLYSWVRHRVDMVHISYSGGYVEGSGNIYAFSVEGRKTLQSSKGCLISLCLQNKKCSCTTKKNHRRMHAV